MRGIRSVFYAGGALILLSQCTIQDDIYQLQNQVRVVNQKVEALRADEVGQMERRQASSVNKLGQVEDETQRIRSSIEENIAQNAQFQTEVNETMAGMRSSLESMRQENNVKIAELNEKIADLDAKMLRMGESQVAQECAQWIENGEGVTVAPYCSLGECQLRVTARGRDEAEALRQVEPVVDAICGVLGDCVYDVTETSDGSMQEAAGRALVARHLTVSTAESCTGGMVAASLVDYPGISECLYEAHVTYANEAKVKYCGVKPETLAAYGAVSEQTAAEMAGGLREKSGADIAVATTGIAGPGGGTKEKPVGLVYVACADKDGVTVERLQLGGDRARVRRLATLKALDMVRRAAVKRYFE